MSSIVSDLVLLVINLNKSLTNTKKYVFFFFVKNGRMFTQCLLKLASIPIIYIIRRHITINKSVVCKLYCIVKWKIKTNKTKELNENK